MVLPLQDGALGPAVKKLSAFRLSAFSLRRGDGDVDWQADDEAGVAGLGLNFKLPGKLLRDDAVNDLETEAGAGALGLSGEERLEDVRKYVGRNA